MSPKSERYDPRDIITPDAFHVKPELLGLPLAGPFRRGAAMLLDLVFVGLLVLTKEVIGFVFWLALAAVLFRVTSRTAREGVGTAAGRAFVRIAAVVILAVGVGGFAIRFLGSDFVASRFGTEDPMGRGDTADAPSTSGKKGGALQFRIDGGAPIEGLGLRDVVLIPDMIALGRAESAEEALPAAERVAEALVRAGASPPETRETLAELLEEGEGAPLAEGAP
ncbi:MAG: hypothetical protein ACRELC_12775, partial [Gemmatimonadota bacterium]